MTPTSYVHIAMELWGTIFCVIAAFCVHISKTEYSRQNSIMIAIQLGNAFMLLNDAISWFFRGNMSSFGQFVIPISNFLVFFTNYITMVIFAEYILSFLPKDRKLKKIVRIVIYSISAIAIISMIISQFNHMYYYIDANNFYHRSTMFMITQIFGLLSAIVYLVVMTMRRKVIGQVNYFALMSYIVLPVVALVVQITFYGISLLSIAMTISGLWLFIVFLIDRTKKMTEQAEELVIREREVNNLQVKMVLSQMQPHFMANSLNTIYYLCDKDAKLAKYAIGEFSQYLRENMDFLRCNQPVPFKDELAHVKKYLTLEKMRFDELLKVEYAIECDDFLLPTLTIQPLVENAVKYGIGKAPQGGTVRIEAKKCEEGYEIIVSDDGIGFDVDEQFDVSRSHTGIENVRKRLETMSRATLEIESQKGKGTNVVIRLPRNVGRDEDEA